MPQKILSFLWRDSGIASEERSSTVQNPPTGFFQRMQRPKGFGACSTQCPPQGHLF